MSIRFVLIAAASALLASAAIAQTTSPAGAPAASSPEDCLKSAFELAQQAENQKMTDEQLDKIEDLLTKLEGHCDNKQFTEAASIAKDLATMIEPKPQ